MLLNDSQKIAIFNELEKQGHITNAEQKELIVKNGKIWDDTNFCAEITEYREILIHSRGAYPIILKVEEIMA